MKYRKEKSLIGLGILLIILPLTGFPRDWKTFLNVLIGVLIVYFGALFLKLAKKSNNVFIQSEIKTETFTETV